ncbi:MAG: hypothetical protein ACO1O6_00405 [Bacteroidota bacterium]
MKYIPFLAIMLLASCSSRDPKMCDCLDAGDKLNDFSAKMLQKEPTSADHKKMIRLREQKKLKCADFQTMSGDEMLKRKATCAE